MEAQARTETEELSVGGDRLRFKVASDATRGEVVVLEVTIPPGGGPPVLHRHDPFELYRVRTGELTVYLEDESGVVERHIARGGDDVPIGSRREHTVRNESDADVVATVLFSPGAPMEQFVRAVASRQEEAPLTPGDVAALAEENGIQMTRPVEGALQAAR